tara:strand:- start:140 stop:301 length:162 start_codon:yes stop_codon:yes gene_type:complete
MLQKDGSPQGKENTKKVQKNGHIPFSKCITIYTPRIARLGAGKRVRLSWLRSK